MSVLRAIIADDERLGRQKIRAMLNGHDDVQMPGSDAFDVLRRLKDESPAIIFVTAHDEYALRAFDVEAVDYLLKPFDRHRFNAALRRARKRIENGTVPQLVSALEELAQR